MDKVSGSIQVPENGETGTYRQSFNFIKFENGVNLVEASLGYEQELAHRVYGNLDPTRFCCLPLIYTQVCSKLRVATFFPKSWEDLDLAIPQFVSQLLLHI